jgi:hypothetical protein
MTAVEWLEEKLFKSSTDDFVDNINKWFLQAKKMEKQQIMEAYNERGYKYESFDDLPEEYYNNTYKK